MSKLTNAMREVASEFTSAPRQGELPDEPEGDVYIQVSHTLAEKLSQVLMEAAGDLDDYDRSFDMYDQGEKRALAMWHELGGEELVWPDKAKMTIWLLSMVPTAEQLDALIDVYNLSTEAADSTFLTNAGLTSRQEANRWLETVKKLRGEPNEIIGEVENG